MAAGDFGHLLALIAGFSKPAAPTRDEQRALWDDVFLCLEDSGEAIKPALLAFLATHAPFLTKNSGALQRNCNRLYLRWQEGSRAS